jgi:organic hydroperoxide reductase OsmC/OhrA
LSVRLPYSREDAVDPEEGFVAALSSCHMLFFLTFAAKAGFVVDSYEDRACGIMEKNSQGKLFVAKVTLDPRIAFSGARQPSPDEIAELHHRSHEECFIANSVKSEVVVAGLPVHA